MYLSIKDKELHMSEGKPKRLGKGLAALIGDGGDESTVFEAAKGQRQIPIEFLKTNPRNPRKFFDAEPLDDLAASIKEKGIIQPILVRAMEGMRDVYEIIAGERRWRAAQKAGLNAVPVLIIDADDKQSLEIAIVENVQRADLNAMEEAAGYEQLMEEFSYTQADLGKVIGKSRSHVANTLRLMKLPVPVKQLVLEGKLSAGHARALLSVADPESVAKRIIEKELSVRDVEKIAQKEQSDVGGGEKKSASRTTEKDPDTLALEEALEAVLGLSVTVNHQGKGGEIRIRYNSLDQLDQLCQKLRD
jgi:ParB family transcriptional regulator, chromosome partitioning protein